MTGDAGARSEGWGRTAWGWGFAFRWAWRGGAARRDRRASQVRGRGCVTEAGPPGDGAGPLGETGPAPSQRARVPSRASFRDTLEPIMLGIWFRARLWRESQ